MTVQAKFSRLVPFYLIPDGDVDDSIGFDAYPVEVDERTLAVAVALRTIKGEMDDLFMNMPAPEEAAQQEATHFEELVMEVLDVADA